VLKDQFVGAVATLVTPTGTEPPQACPEPKSIVAAEVPVPPSVIPEPSVTNVKLIETTVVEVTATVPVAEVALVDGAASAAIASASPNVTSIFHSRKMNLRFTRSSAQTRFPGEKKNSLVSTMLR
jgi:hypothetical protein